MNLELPRTVIVDAEFAPDHIVGNHRAQNVRPQIHLRLVHLKLATAHQEAAADGLQRSTTFVVVVPIAKGAIGKTDRPPAGNFGDLIARTPKGAIGKAHGTPVA